MKDILFDFHRAFNSREQIDRYIQQMYRPKKSAVKELALYVQYLWQQHRIFVNAEPAGAGQFLFNVFFKDGRIYTSEQNYDSYIIALETGLNFAGNEFLAAKSLQA